MDTPNYRDPFIAMAFFACLFFIILVVIVVIWCKSRRKVEIKTVNIQPKKRPVTIKSVTSNGDTPANGDRKLEADVEAGVISSEGITLETDDRTDTAPPAVEAKEAEPSSQQTEEPASNNQEPTDDSKEADDNKEAQEQQKTEDDTAEDNTAADKADNDPIETADTKEQVKDSTATTDSAVESPQQSAASEGHSNPSFQSEEVNDS